MSRAAGLTASYAAVPEEQGDPGSSQFFVSLEDNLMRLFGSERISNLMVRMGIEEGEVIQHSMISNSIERAQ